MARKTLVMPELGESVAEATLSRWLVAEGERFQKDQVLAEVSTDKADTELPAFEAGSVARLLVKEGETVATGAPIAELDYGASSETASERMTDADTKPLSKPAPVAAAHSEAPTAEEDRPQEPRPVPVPAPPRARGGRRLSPLVRHIAEREGLDLARVEALQGSGANGRVTRDDLLAHLGALRSDALASAKEHAPRGESEPATARAALYRPPRYHPLPGDRLIPFTRRRRLIAEHMRYSVQTSPHVPCLAEIDMHAVIRARARAAKRGEATSLTAWLAWATARALEQHPALNATVTAEGLILREQINLGIAIDAAEGLLVPVVRTANRLNPYELSMAIDGLAERGRAGSLSADDFSDGTFTISNLGANGNAWGAAIINQPQVGIVRMGELVKRPVVVTIDGEELLAIRPVANVVLSYDHRAVDGVAANRFLRAIRAALEALSDEVPAFTAEHAGAGA